MNREEPKENTDRRDLNSSAEDAKAKLSRKVWRLDQRVLALLNNLGDQLDELGEDIFGQDFYTGSEDAPEEWKQLSTHDRNKLRVAFAFDLVSNNIIEDFRKNPYLIAIAIGPGPLGTVIAAALLASYAVRTDERGKELRKQIAEMLDKGVQFEDYEHVLRNGKYTGKPEVDNIALLKKSFELIKNSSVSTQEEFIENTSRMYKDFKEASGIKISAHTHFQLDDYIPPSATAAMLRKAGQGYDLAERGTIEGTKYTIAGASWVGRNILSPIFNFAVDSTVTSYQIAQDLTEQAFEGYDYNKKEIQDLISRLSPKK